MTEQERDAEVNRYLREYADNEKTLVCLRERLLNARKGLEMLNLDSDRYPSAGSVDAARATMNKPMGDVLDNFDRYARAL